MTMLRRAAQCCCPPIAGPNCRAFQIDCFNTANHASFPEYAKVVGSSACDISTYPFGSDGCECAAVEVEKISISFELTMRKTPPNPPSGGFGCIWTTSGSDLDRACWAGRGGTYLETRFRRIYQFCDYSRNHPGYGCGCLPAVGADICRQPRLLVSERTVTRRGICSGAVSCQPIVICVNGSALSIWGHRVQVGVIYEEEVSEQIFEPFCNFCTSSSPFPGNPCSYSSRYPMPPLGDSTVFESIADGVTLGCAGEFIGGDRECPGAGYPTFGRPYGYIGCADMGDRKYIDACGRTWKRTSANGILSFL